MLQQAGLSRLTGESAAPALHRIASHRIALHCTMKWYVAEQSESSGCGPHQ